MLPLTPQVRAVLVIVAAVLTTLATVIPNEAVRAACATLVTILAAVGIVPPHKAAK